MPNEITRSQKKIINRPKYDYFARIWGSSSEEINIAAYETESVVSSLNDFLRERDSIYIQVIKQMKKRLDFDGHYFSYLLDQINEDEFKKISEEFSEEPISCEDLELERKISFLIHNTGISFSVSDFSNFWGCPEEQIEKAFKKIEASNSGISQYDIV